MMNRAFITILLFLLLTKGKGQIPSAAAIVKNYSAAQKRLVIVSTFQFINFITQHNLDPDSVLAIACRITGSPFPIPYDNMPVSGAEKKIRALLEAGKVYLYRPGTHKADIDSARRCITDALTLSVNGQYKTWETECRFLEGEVFAQSGEPSKSKNIYLQLVSRGQALKDTLLMARAWQQMGKLMDYGDSLKLSYYKRALTLYQKKQATEKVMELLWDAATYNTGYDFDLLEASMQQILQLQQSAGYKHSLYVQYVLSYVALIKTKYVDALKYGKGALENMQWSGIHALSATFFMRIGAGYWGLDQSEDGLSWFRKALATRTRDTHLFWYKSLIYITELLADENRAHEALEMIIGVTRDFPPITIWESMQVLSIKGKCYEMLQEPQSADIYYMELLALRTAYPHADPNAELLNTFFQIGRFYVSQGKLQKARQFEVLANSYHISRIYEKYEKYWLRFKLDSAVGKYQAAMQAHIKYIFYRDSITRMDQRKKIDELTLESETAKRDKDIALLKEKGVVQQSQLKQNMVTRNVMFGGTATLLVIVGLLFHQFKSKQRANRAIHTKNAMLQHLLEEKEWLLKEVHHRVKNNLHTVICLLESQARHLENDALKAIEVCQHRIYAMSLIHQQLYQLENVKTIDMPAYLSEFIRYLDESFGTEEKIDFRLDIEPLQLGVAQAIPIALIVNEAVTNSIKYAFPGDRRGTIAIEMKKTGDTVVLCIRDNGIGIAPALVEGPSGSLGLKLIRGLSEDIHATLRFENEGGTSIFISFPPGVLH